MAKGLHVTTRARTSFLGLKFEGLTKVLGLGFQVYGLQYKVGKGAVVRRSFLVVLSCDAVFQQKSMLLFVYGLTAEHASGRLAEIQDTFQ